MGFPHPGTGQSMRRIRYKPGNIQSIIMLSFSMLSLAIMLVTVVVMYIKFADASQDSIIESNHKVMDQTIDSVESYLVNMRQVRYKNKFEVSFEVDEEIMDYCAVKLVLQPILENALNYGIRELDDFGEIVVGGKKVGEDIIITVSDNGMGIPENEIPLLLTNTDRVHKKGSGVGLVNVNNRIKILFGERYGLHIESELDEGTVVTIKIPAIVYSEENRLQFEEHHIV